MSLAAVALVAPLAAAAAILLIRRWVVPLALLGAGAALVAALITLGRVAGGDRFAATVPGLPGLPLRLVVDPLGALLTMTVAVTAAFVLVYAVGYMEQERDQARFFAGMAFFAAAMQALVLAGDWVLFLAAWELIGLASYLLIGFWFERPGVPAAATRAFMTTRTADLGLYLGVFVLVNATGTTAIAAPRPVGGATAAVAGLAFLVAATGKSAQAPFQGWLQDAMVGPTPVSALLHSATLVVAGVVLLTRAFPLLPSGVLLVVGLVGGVTALLTGLMAVAERDLKRLLAASTSSQVGLMFLALGAGSVGAAIVHLVAQAAMKSSLFLGAGIFQHERRSTSFADLRGIGRARRAVFAAFVVAGLALAGVPPLAGFWSKDAVIAAALRSSHAGVLAPLALAATLLTGAYVGRALRLLWRGPHAARQTAGAAANAGAAAGTGWMDAGLLGLTTLAAVLGLAVRPIGRLLDVEVPEDVAGVGLGLAAAAAGLLVGWQVPADRILGPSDRQALVGFRVGGGFDGLVARPVLVLARAGDRFDRWLHAGVLAVGRRTLAVAVGAGTFDAAIQVGVEAVDTLALGVARAARLTDDAAIDGLIAVLVARTRWLGGRARRLQTGLVHRELLVAAAGTALVMLLVLFS